MTAFSRDVLGLWLDRDIPGRYADGVRLLQPVHVLDDFGHRVVFFSDPEQNVIELFAEL